MSLFDRSILPSVSKGFLSSAKVSSETAHIKYPFIERKDHLETVDLSLEERENEIDELVQGLYQSSTRQFVPRYPWILCRILQKEHVTRGGIVLPATDQHKPMLEAIVLVTWRPFTQERGKVLENGRKFSRTVVKQSQFEPGQHVLLPHWAGLPHYGLNDQRYRYVKEEDWQEDKDGGIVAFVDYEDKANAPNAVLREMLADGIIEDQEVLAVLAAKIEQRFLLVDREAKSVTLSGT
jgi:co-chaperonin GroES (HSP10)